MKLIFLLAFISVASAGHFVQNFINKYQKFADMKVMEGCFGQEAYKKYIMQYIKACAKCGNRDVPELSFLANPAKLVSSLISGAESDIDSSMKSHRVINIHGDFYNKGNIGESVKGNANADYLLNKLLEKLGIEDEHTHKHTHEDGTTHSHSHSDGHHDDEHTHTHTHEDGTTHEHSHSDGHHEDGDDAHAESESESESEAEAESHRESREMEVGDGSSFLAMGLKKKILENKNKIASKIGNVTCVMKELGYVNEAGDLDLDGIIKSYEIIGDSVDPWMRKRCEKSSKLCYDEAQATPQSVLDDCTFGPQFAKIKSYAVCHEFRSMVDCMQFDTKQKMEQYFGSIDKIVEESGLEEKQLLMLVQKLMYGGGKHQH